MILETVKRVLAGDSQAYREIVREYGPMVRVQLFSHLKDHHAVEDLSQEVFVAAYWALESYDPARDFRTWIAGIVRNKLMSHLRKQALARRATFEANLDLLARAELTCDKRDLAAAAIAGAKIDDNTPARAAWLLKSLQTDQTESITHFATSRTQGDFKAASYWLNSLPQGRSRDAAVVGFAPAAARIDGASAVDWALTISDPEQRTSTLNKVSQAWKSREPAAAAYLRDKGIDAE